MFSSNFKKILALSFLAGAALGFINGAIHRQSRLASYTASKETKIEQLAEDNAREFVANAKIPLSGEHQKHLLEVCEKFKVPYAMALAVIEVESTFRQDARNGSSYGLMQINSICKKNLKEKLGIIDIKEPKQNMTSGVWMLSKLRSRYGSWSKALVCYNHGERGAHINVFRYGRTETAYSRKVLEKHKKWRSILAEQ